MAINTRFNPTVSGPLHLGHLYLCLVNEHEAHNANGLFIVRFDDAQESYIYVHGMAKIACWRDEMKRDLDQFITVDRYTSEAEDYYNALHQRPDLFKTSLHPTAQFHSKINIASTLDGEYFPFVPCLTIKKVYLDAMEGITHLYRGKDLITEFALYEYFRERAGIYPVEHYYLPKLRMFEGPVAPSVSKTMGTYQISTMTAKYGRDGVLDILRRSCLIDPNRPFTALNIKDEPKLEL